MPEVATVSAVDPERARELLANERARIEQALASLSSADLRPLAERDDPGDEGSETLYDAEFDEGVAADLTGQLAAVERAEARLAAGTYGLSVESGEPIPDERLEVLPAAERTLAEQQRYDRG
jgi:DnaK suppressor protein